MDTKLSIEQIHVALRNSVLWNKRTDIMIHRKKPLLTSLIRWGKKGTWEANPYVFVYDFELTK